MKLLHINGEKMTYHQLHRIIKSITVNNRDLKISITNCIIEKFPLKGCLYRKTKTASFICGIEVVGDSLVYDNYYETSTKSRRLS